MFFYFWKLDSLFVKTSRSISTFFHKNYSENYGHKKLHSLVTKLALNIR